MKEPFGSVSHHRGTYERPGPAKPELTEEERVLVGRAIEEFSKIDGVAKVEAHQVLHSGPGPQKWETYICVTATEAAHKKIPRVYLSRLRIWPIIDRRK